MKVLYTAEATATGGRQGGVRSSDGNLDVTLVSPPELGGPGGEGTNPEQLFAAGYAGCFHSALLVVANGKKLDADGSTVTARVGLGPRDEGPGFGLSVALRVALPKLDRESAERLVASAHKVCPYSNAVRDNVDVQLEVEAGSETAAPA
jgi:Ohr subfamily peroxiredoxin